MAQRSRALELSIHTIGALPSDSYDESRQHSMFVFFGVLLGWCVLSMVVGLGLGRVFALRGDEHAAAPAEEFAHHDQR